MSDAERANRKWDAETVIGNVSEWAPKANHPQVEVPEKSFRSAEPGATTIMDVAAVMATHARAKGSFDTATVVFQPQRPEPSVLLPQPVASASAPSTRDPRYVRLRRFAELCRDDFRRTPRSVRATLIALPIIAWATLALSGSESEASPGGARPAGRSEPSSRVEARPNVAASATTRPQAPEQPATSSSASAPAASTAGSKPGKGRSLEATAVDAVARGDHARAAALYDELAAQNPERPEFRTAARILRTKQGSR